MGRKKLPDDIIRTRVLKMMINEEEWELIEKAAKMDGFDEIGPWVRRATVRAARDMLAPKRKAIRVVS